MLIMLKIQSLFKILDIHCASQIRFLYFILQNHFLSFNYFYIYKMRIIFQK